MASSRFAGRRSAFGRDWASMTGTLYVVATPIGNLADVSRRAVTTLESVAVIACEDTRVTRKLLTTYGIERPTVSYHAHSGGHTMAKLIDRLLAGEDVAVVSDAGTPLISDPGAELVAEAAANGIPIVPIPGPSALLAAVMGAGLPPQPLLFLGFAPRHERDRREVLGPLRSAPYTLVLYEAPGRVVDLLVALERSLGDRPACVARELTKRFETFHRGRLSELVVELEARPPQGEVVVVVAPAGPDSAAPSEDEMKAAASRWLADGQSPAEVARAIAGAYGVPKRQAYKLVVSLRTQAHGADEDRGVDGVDEAGEGDGRS